VVHPLLLGGESVRRLRRRTPTLPLGFAKIFSEADGLSLSIVALAPPLSCAGNKKELPDFV